MSGRIGRLLALVLLAGLAGCGADGEPQPLDGRHTSPVLRFGP